MHQPASSKRSFIGRRRELTDIYTLLGEPDCRLVTLHGPGGVGKSRLAQQLAGELGDEYTDGIYTDGIYFVPLQGVEMPSVIVSTVADVLQLALRGEDDPRSQLFDRLRMHNCLLILDNLEHLLTPRFADETRRFIAGILGAAPAVTLLITSREVLNLREEWVFPLRGLPCPVDAEDTASATPTVTVSESLQLFADRARQIRADFRLQDDFAGAIRICQLVDGLPLALELAASWTKILTCSAIADEIERNLAFLAAAQHNVSPRHQSLEAVFEHSWALLADDERLAMARLAVFRDGFRREVTRAVADIRLSVLASLADKSLLQMQPDGRYRFHELLRQFAERYLLASPRTTAKMRAAHCAYYCAFLHQRRDTVAGLNPRPRITEIWAEMPNIRVAWRYAVQSRRADLIQQAAYTLFCVYDFQGRYRENRDQFQAAIDALDTPESGPRTQAVLAELLTLQGMSYLRLGQLNLARMVLERSLVLYEYLDVTHPPGLGTDPRVELAIIACIEADYDAAAGLGENALQIAVSARDIDNEALALYALANAYRGQGDFSLARSFAERAYVVAKSGSVWFSAYCLNIRGELAVAQADYVEAIRCFQLSDTIRSELDDLEGMALARRHLADIAALQDEHARARLLYAQSVTLYEEIDDRGGLATALHGLIRTEHTLHETMAELEHCRQALSVVQRTQLSALKLSIIADVGELMLDTEWRLRESTQASAEQTPASPPISLRARSIELLSFVYHWTATPSSLQKRVASILAQCNVDPEQAQVKGFFASEAIDLNEIIVALGAELASLTAGARIDPRTHIVDGGQSAQELIEPLTTRELEIVALLAQGLSNQEIAASLSLTVGTIRWYTSQIYGKLGVRSRTQAVARGRELQFIP